MIQGISGGKCSVPRTKLFAVLFSLLMVCSIVAPVGTVGASGVADDGGLADGTEGLLSSGFDGEEENLLSSEGDDGEEVDDSEETEYGPDELDGDDGAEDGSGDSSDSDQVHTTSASDTSCDVTVGEGESIQSVIDAADPGDTICVELGSYSEELEIATEGLTLVGVGDAPTISSSWGDDVAITVTAENVTIENVRAVGFDTHGILLDEAHGAVIEDVDVVNNQIGIEVVDTHSVEVRDSLSENNGVGVETVSSSDVEVLDSEVVGGSFGSGSDSAITVFDSDGVVLQGNKIDDVREHGVGTLVVDSSTDVIVDENTFENNWEGIEIVDSTDVTLSNNVIADNQVNNAELPSVLVAESDGVILDDNEISGGNFGVDVVLQNATNAELVDNEFETGLLLEGEILDHFVHTVEGNTVDGKALVYSEGETAPTVNESAGQHIFVDATDLIVEDHAFEGSAAPLQIAFSDGAEVRNNTVSGATIDGWADTAALVVHASSGAVVEANTVSNNPGHGLGLSGSTDAIVRQNVVTNNGEAGIHVAGATGGTVTNNSATMNELDGIRVSGADGTVIEDNDVSQNERDGIRVVSGVDIEVVANEAADNEADGIRVVDAADVLASENVLDGNDESGIHVDGSTDPIVTDNYATSQDHGLLIATSVGGLLTENNVTSNAHGIHVEGSEGTQLSNNDVFDNTEGIVVEDSTDVVVNANTVWENSGVLSAGSGILVVDSGDVEVTENLLTDNDFVGVIVDGSDGTIVENNTGSGQEADLVLKESTAAEVRDNTFETGLFIDGAELSHFVHTVTNNTVAGEQLYYVSGADDPAIPADAAQIVVADSTNMVVKDHDLDGVAVGIQVAYSDGAEISENTVTDTTLTTQQSQTQAYMLTRPGAITVRGSNEASIDDNTVERGHTGIRVDDATDVLVSNNHAHDHRLHGISIEDAPGATVSENTLTENDASNAGIGVSIRGSYDVTVADNDFTENFDGIDVRDSPSITIVGNYVADGWQPITVRDSDSALVDSNVVEDGTGVSIRLLDSDGTALNNTITGGTNSGIYTNRADVTIEDNYVENAGGHGIALNGHQERSSYATVVNNTVVASDEHGIWVRNVLDGSSIHGNTVTDAGGNGVHFSGSYSWWITENLDLHDNTISGAAQYGINLHRVEGVVRNNSITNNGDGGIRASHQADVEIAWNDVTNNPSHGIIVDGADMLSVHNNTASNNHADLFLDEATNTIAHDNTFQAGVLIEGDDPSYFEHEFNGSTVNGGSIQVFLDDDDHVFDATVGQLIVAFADDVDIGGVNVGDDIASIQITESGDIDVDDLDLADGLGIHVTNSGNVSVTESTVMGATPAAIHVETAGDVTVTNTTIGAGQGNGIWLESVGSVDIQHNAITEREETGIHVHTAETVFLHDNAVSDGGSIGVWIEEADDATLTDIVISGNDGDGLVLKSILEPVVEDTTVAENGGDGMILGNFNSDSVDGTQLISTEIVDNDGTGLFVSRSDDVHVENATIEANGVGIDVLLGSGFGLTDSTVQNNDGDGVHGTGLSNLVIADSVVADNAGHGLALTQSGGGSGFLIESNTISNNGDGLSLDGDTRFGAEFTDIVVTDNAIWNNAGTGIAVLEEVEEANDILLEYNSIEGNGDGVTYVEDSCGGFYDGPCLDATNNWWGHESGPSGEGPGQGDSVGTAIDYEPFLDEDHLDDTPDPAVFELSIDATNSPVDAGDDLEVDITVTNAGEETGTQTIELEEFDRTVVDTDELTLDGGESEQLTLTWSTTSADAGQDTIVVRSEDESVTEQVAILTGDTIAIDTCTTITMPGNYTLTGDLAGSDTCIQIAASDVHFDGNGHTIQGSGDGEGIYIHNAGDRVENVVVENVTVDDFTFGVRLNNVGYSELADVTTTNSSSGLYLYDADWNEFSNITTRDNTFRGIYLSTSHRNTFTDVEAHDNEDGSSWSSRGTIYLTSSSHNTFERVEASDGRVGVRIVSGVVNSFSDLTALDNQYHGLEVHSNSNSFEDVHVSGSGWEGIRIAQANSNSFENVNSSYNDGTGIRLTGDSRGSSDSSFNTLTNVTAIGNDPSGVALSYASGNTLDGLTLTANAGHSLGFSSSDGNTISNVTVVDGGSAGVSFVGNTADNTVSTVSIANTSGPAISFQGGNGRDMTGNHLSNVAVTDSGPAFVSSWEATDNAVEHMDLDGTVVSFSARDVVIDGAETPTELPEGLSPLEAYLDISDGPTSPSDEYEPRVDHLHFHYDATDVAEIDESTLEIWRLNESWSSPANESYVGGVNTTGGYVWAENVTDFSTFGVFSEGPVPVASVSNVDLSTDELVQGENATITADVENVGGTDGTVTVPLEVDGTIVDTVTVDLDQNETTSVEFTHAFDDLGEYDVSVSGETAGTVTVLSGPDVVVYGADVDPEPLPLGDTLTVTANLYNSGDAVGDETLELLVDGTVVDVQNVSVEPGLARGGATLEWDSTDFEVPEGELSETVNLSVSGFDLGTLNVENAYSDVQVIAASASETEVIEGDELYVIGSVYQAGTVADEEEIELTATHLESNETTTVGTQNVTVSPNVYHLGALNVTFAPDQAGTYDLELGDRYAGTVEVEPAESDIQVIAAALSEGEIVAGDELHVIGSLYQTGNIAGPQNISLTAVDQESGDTTNLTTVEHTVAPNVYHLGAINETFTLEESGTYEIYLDDRNAGTLEVEEAYSDTQVIAASASATEVIEGEELYVIGSVYQAGTIAEEEEIELTATRLESNETTTVGTQNVTVSPNVYHLGALNITFEPDQAGTYELELGERYAGTVDVEPAESNIQVIAASISEAEIVAGEELHVIGSVYQAGNVAGPQNISLTAVNTGTDQTTNLTTVERTVSPNVYHLGSINETFTLGEGGTYDIYLDDRNAGTLEVEPAYSDIQVIAAAASATEVIEGEELHVIGSVYQNGTVASDEEIELTATHLESNETTTIATQNTGTIWPNVYWLGAINISFTPDQAGTYELKLGDRPAGTVEVEPAYSDIQVIAASPDGYNLTVGEEVNIIGSVYQAGNIAGEEEIELNATHRGTNETATIGTQNVTVSPNVYHLGALNISFEPDQAGTYDLELGGRDAGSVAVEESLSDIQVVGASVADVELIEGEQTHVIGSIYQAGEEGGTETIELTATHNETGVTEVVGSQDVTLSPGYYHLGAINISFEPDEPGTYDLQLGDRDAGWVEVEPAYSDIQVIAASISEAEIVAGDELYVIGSVYQAGTIAGPQDISLTAVHQESGNTTNLSTVERTVAPNVYHLGAINETFTLEESGTYEIYLDDRNSGTLEVLPAESNIQVIAASASATEVIEGEELHVIGSVYQSGTIAGEEEIELTATHLESNETTTVGTQNTGTIGPNVYWLGALNVSFSPDQAGTYELELGERYAGTVEVEPAISDIQVIAASTSEGEIVAGDELHVIGSLYQAGTIDGPQEIPLNATNTGTDETTTLTTVERTVAPNVYHLGAINETFTLTEPGTYEIELGDRNAGTLEVLPAESDIQVIAASAADTEIPLGTQTHVIGSVYQAGTIADEEEIELTATNLDSDETTIVGTQSVTVAPNVYHLGALNVTFEPDQVGTYELELGERYAGTVEVVKPTVEPSIVDVAGHSSGYDLDLETDAVYASEDTTVTLDVESDLDLDEVTLLVSSLQTTYSIPVDAVHDDGHTWHAEVPVDSIPDDGAYALSVIAVDEHGHDGFAADADTLVIDGEEPGMSVTLEGVDGDDATVLIESNEPLAETPDISAELIEPDGSTSEASVTIDSDDGTGTQFTGTLEFYESGTYTVTVAGTDRAGNVGENNASVVVNTGFTLGDGEIVIDETGTSVAFDLVDEAEDAIKTEELFLALSENSLNANLDGGEIGVGFLTAELDSFIDYQFDQGTIEGATISMAIDEDGLADGVETSDVGIYHYDEPADEWTAVDSTVTTIGNDPFVTADVTGFSTYGALVIDEEAPKIQVAESPDGDTVRFTYEDDLSGIDLGSVAISVDGTAVTDDDGTSITSSSAEHSFDADPGESFSVTISVADKAGNDATATTSFTLEDDSDDGDADDDDSDDGDADDADGDADEDDSDDGDADEDDSDDGDADEDDSDNGDTDSKKDADDADDDDTSETGDADDADDTDSTDGEMDDGDADDDEPTDESDDSIPGFGLVTALVALLSIALFRTRSQRS